MVRLQVRKFARGSEIRYAPAIGCGRDELMSRTISSPVHQELQPRVGQRLVVLIPCFNEEAAIGKVVADFSAALPEATIYVYDNNSTDRTVEVARTAGAVVRRELHQGKGNVVRRMFADVDADVSRAGRRRRHLRRIERARHDRTADRRPARHGGGGARRAGAGRLSPGTSDRKQAFHPLFRLGLPGDLHGHPFRLSRLLAPFREVLPGSFAGFRDRDRARRSRLELELAVAEVATPYYARPEGSESKLNTWRDGVRILATMLGLYRSERPLAFFSGVGALSPSFPSASPHRSS